MPGSLWFSVGRRALQRRHQTGLDQPEPPGLRGDGLDQWRQGYGGSGIACVSLPVSKESLTMPPPRDARPYAAYSTKETRRRSQPSENSSRRSMRPVSVASNSAQTSRERGVSSTSCSSQTANSLNGPKGLLIATRSIPLSQLDLWGNVIEPVEAKGASREPVIPLAEMDARRNELVSIGIGLTLAETLVAKNWTLDQLTVQILLPVDDADHAKCVQEAMPIVARHVDSLRSSYVKR
jgi:hypothetical protein